MKNFFCNKILFIFFTILSNFAYSQWEPDVRLTFNDSVSFSNDQGIGVSGNSVFIVWTESRDGNTEIYFKKSTNNGLNWGSDIRLTFDPNVSVLPAIEVSGQTIHLVWRDGRDGNTEIYYKKSTNLGETWGSDTRLTNNTGSSNLPHITVMNQIINVVWRDERDGNTEIYCKRSNDGGNTWGIDTRLTNNSSISEYPMVTGSGSLVFVVWCDTRDGTYSIYYKRSSDNGLTWSSDIRLSEVQSSLEPYIVASGMSIHCAWSSYQSSIASIYYKHSTDGGITWFPESQLVSNPASPQSPILFVSSNIVHMVWHDLLVNESEIYYKRTTDGGANWNAETRLTNNVGLSYSPIITGSNSIVHVAWTERRDGNDEIYYKRNPTANIIGIHNISLEIPREYSLSQNYPNPFNPTTIIKFSLSSFEFVRLKVFDALGREINTLISESLKPGEYEYTFDGLNLPSGVYYYSIITSDFIQTKSMVLIK